MINAYTIMMAVILFLGLLLHGTEAHNKKFIFLSCLIMFFLMGFRDLTIIGTDTRSTYRASFMRVGTYSFSDIFRNYDMQSNSGFTAALKLLFEVTDGDYQGAIIILAAFFMISFYYLVQKYSVDPLQSICYYWGLLLYLFLYSGLKQGMAMSVLVFAFDAIIDRKLLRFLILVVLAGQFHYPAIIFLPAYFVAGLKPGRYLFLLLIIGLVVTYVFRDQLLTFMMNAYEDDTGSLYSLGNSRFLTNKAIIMLVIVVVGLILRRPTEEDKLFFVLLCLISISIVFQTFSTFNNIFERLADYYFQFSVIFIPLVFEKGENRQSILSPKLDYIVKDVAPVLFCAFGVWRCASYVMIPETHHLPYRFFF